MDHLKDAKHTLQDEVMFQVMASGHSRPTPTPLVSAPCLGTTLNPCNVDGAHTPLSDVAPKLAPAQD